jgi:OFA family oxalate/formate antiporter-like MFS transporter
MSTRREALPVSRWWLVVVAALAMGFMGTYQFAWSSIRVTLGTRLGATETGVGTVFTVFLVFQTLSQFPAGWVRDRWGPRVPLLVGTPLLATGYVGTAIAGSLLEVYVAYALGGIGGGIIYTVAVNTAVKWFTDRRGLATGAVTMAYSGVSFLLIPAIRRGVEAAFTPTLTILGVGVGATALLAAIVLRDPPSTTDGDGEGTEVAETAEPDAGETHSAATDAGETTTVETDSGETDSEASEADADAAEQHAVDAEPRASEKETYSWRAAIRTWQFWLMYAVFAVVNGVGLMLIGKVIAFAGALGLPAAVATASASVVAFSDAAGIAVIGSLSDRLGRVRTVAGSLVLTGVALAAAALVGNAWSPWVFVAFAGAAALFRSPAFAIFPSLVGEYYGLDRSSENYALLYTAKLWGSLFGGTVASALIITIGWQPSFLLAAGGIAIAGVATSLLRAP